MIIVAILVCHTLLLLSLHLPLPRRGMMMMTHWLRMDFSKIFHDLLSLLQLELVHLIQLIDLLLVLLLPIAMLKKGSFSYPFFLPLLFCVCSINTLEIMYYLGVEEDFN